MVYVRRGRARLVTVGLVVALAVASVTVPPETEAASAAEPASVSAAELIARRRGIVVVSPITPAVSAAAEITPMLDDIWLVRLADPSDRGAVLDELRRSPDVLSADLETVASVGLVPDDPCVTRCVVGTTPTSQAYLADMDVLGAWDVSTGSPDVVVAVLDSGVIGDHPDLAGRVTRWDDCSVHPPPTETGANLDHGTAVASIIGSATDDGAGLAGIGWNATVVDVQVLIELSGLEADIAAGIICAVDRGADVINLSLTTRTDSPLLRAAVAYAIDHDVVVVAAAGNQGVGSPTDGSAGGYPAAYAGVIAVGAADGRGDLAGFSNFGDWVDVLAPGVNVLMASARAPTGYVRSSGTSFSSPMIAGVAALLRSDRPDWRQDQVARRIERTATAYPQQAAARTGGVAAAAAAMTAIDRGHWMTDRAGRVAAFADAPFLGDLSGVGLASPVVGMAATPSGGGYWLVAADGGVFTYGDAGFFGSAGGLSLVSPVVGMAATPSGGGYWSVAGDGGIFTFGNAAFDGSAVGRIGGGERIVGMAAADGAGYRLAANTGDLFSFGAVPYPAWSDGLELGPDIVGMAIWS